MRILVPTDFSKPAENAAEYAAKMSLKLQAEMVLLHIAFIEGSPHAAMLKEKKIEETMLDYSRQDGTRLMQKLRKGNKSLKVTFDVIADYPVRDAVTNFAGHHDIDYIIMGTKGASGMKKLLIGSNAASVISYSDVPVIIVPEHARFKNIKSIVYASDLHALTSEMKEIISFARLFNATVHIVHVLPPDSKKGIDQTTLKNKLVRQYKYPGIITAIIPDDDPIEGIEKFIGKTDADLLAMFTHKPTFFEKLLGKSATREMAFHSRVPLLSIKKRSKKK